MRFTLLVTLLSLMAMGCRANPRCQRENAMLRAELLDLEDKYYSLMSEQGEGTTYIGESAQIIVSPQPFEDHIVEPGIVEPGASLNRNDQGNSSIGLRGIGFSQSGDGDVRISNITINQRATRGHDVDGNLGDEGVDLLVQTRTADGAIRLQAGELTVSIIDPAEEPDRQRVGLWKFLPSETELFFANHELGSRGILLHLPWDQSTPTHSRLTLHVRFVTPDGRVLKTSTELRITPPTDDYSPDDPLVARWTQRDDRWGTASEPDWHPKADGSRRLQASSGGSEPDPISTSDPMRRRIKAIPVKSTRLQPAWRPVR